MIELRTYEGDAAEISRFVQDSWRTTYQGKMPIPVWDERYMDWQLLADRPGGRDFLVVAYEGSKLVGSVLAEAFQFRVMGQDRLGTMGSWLTVHPEYSGTGVSRKMILEQLRRHQAHGAGFGVGFLYHGNGKSIGPKFWKLKYSQQMVLPGKVGWWVRLLDHRAIADWELSRTEGRLARVAGWFQGEPSLPSPRHLIRPYRDTDLPDCLELVNGLVDRVDLGYLWSPSRLAHQLDYKGIPRTLVLEEGGKVAGFLNYYRLEFLGHYPIAVGMIDLMPFGNLSGSARRSLMRAALHQMRQEGLKSAMVLNLPTWDRCSLMATGFFPLPGQFDLACFQVDPTIPLRDVRRYSTHFR